MKVAKLVLLNIRSKKVVTDKALWYKAAAKELGIELEHQTFGERNVVERAFMPLKKRMKGFFKRFPANSKYETVWIWIAYFLLFVLSFLIG